MKPVTFPPALVELLEQQLGQGPRLEQLIEYSARPLRKSIRVNTLKISVDEFQNLADQQGWKLIPVPWCQEGFWVELDDDQLSLGNFAAHLGGLYYVQEASSMLPVSALFHALGDKPAELVLDAAAAPGSKTTQLAAKLGGLGLVLANEYSATRSKVLSANLLRCGAANVATSNFSAEIFGAWTPECFDAILLDAPCSGEGTLRKDPEALSNWSLGHVEEIAELQYRLLVSALHALKPGGVLVYSTCTLNQIENQQLVQRLLEEYPNNVSTVRLDGLFAEAKRSLTEQGYLHMLPQDFDCEGFFVAALQKSEFSMPAQAGAKKISAPPFKPASKKQAQAVSQYYYSHFGIELNGQQLFVRDKEYWLLPQGIEHLMGKIRLQRLGMKLCDEHKHGFKTSHQAARSLADNASNNVVELSEAQARDYYLGRDIAWPNQNKGEVLLSYQGVTIGLAKYVKGKLKNSLPRELVRDGGLF